MSTAHAKARLSQTITEKDAQAAEAILRFALFKEVLKREKRKKRRLNNGRASVGVDESETEGEFDEDEDMENDAPPRLPDEEVTKPAAPLAEAKQAQAKVLGDPGINPQRFVLSGVPS